MDIKRWNGEIIRKREWIDMGVSMAILQPITGETVDKFLTVADKARLTKDTLKKAMELASLVEIDED